MRETAREENNVQSTDDLIHILDTICSDEKERIIVKEALKEAMNIHQWNYQKATTRQNRDVLGSLDKAAHIVKEHLEFLGEYELIKNLDNCLYPRKLIKSNILTEAQRTMKEYCTNRKEVINPNIKKQANETKSEHIKKLQVHTYEYADIIINTRRYNEEFSKRMRKAFIELCEQYPLDNAPEHFDSTFEPPIY